VDVKYEKGNCSLRFISASRNVCSANCAICFGHMDDIYSEVHVKLDRFDIMPKFGPMPLIFQGI